MPALRITASGALAVPPVMNRPGRWETTSSASITESGANSRTWPLFARSRISSPINCFICDTPVRTSRRLKSTSIDRCVGDAEIQRRDRHGRHLRPGELAGERRRRRAALDENIPLDRARSCRVTNTDHLVRAVIGDAEVHRVLDRHLVGEVVLRRLERADTSSGDVRRRLAGRARLRGDHLRARGHDEGCEGPPCGMPASEMLADAARACQNPTR